MTNRPPRMTVEDLGAFFIRDAALYRLVTYTAQPTAALLLVHGEGPERIGGVVGSPCFEGFERLIPTTADAETRLAGLRGDVLRECMKSRPSKQALREAVSRATKV